MCRALNREDLVDDERFATPLARGRNADARKQIMADEIARWRRDDILARFDAHDVPSAPLLTRMELMDHEQIRVNGSITRTTWADFGEVRQAIPAARFSVSPSEIKRPAAAYGTLKGLYGADDPCLAHLWQRPTPSLARSHRR